MGSLFVVTGCGRSGTSFLARLLTAGGIRTSHEEFFWPRRTRLDLPEFRDWLAATRTVGEISGFAAPFSRQLAIAAGVRQYLLVRNPVLVIASMLGLRQFETCNAHLDAIKFIYRHLPGLDPTEPPADICARFWIEWNALVRPDHVMRIEDLTPDLVADVWGISSPKMAWKAAQARANAGPRASFQLSDISSGALRGELLSYAASLGYAPEELMISTEGKAG